MLLSLIQFHARFDRLSMPIFFLTCFSPYASGKKFGYVLYTSRRRYLSADRQARIDISLLIFSSVHFFLHAFCVKDSGERGALSDPCGLSISLGNSVLLN
jgi:hypothetical protein